MPVQWPVGTSARVSRWARPLNNCVQVSDDIGFSSQRLMTTRVPMVGNDLEAGLRSMASVIGLGNYKARSP